jgi:co-chaperonin GroES (HSP10)
MGSSNAVGEVGSVSLATSSTAPGMTVLEKQRREKIKQEEKEMAELEEAIPKPAGYMVLVAMPEVEDTFDNTSLVKSNQTLREENILASIGLVLDMGEQAYKDPERYPTGPRCKVGDYVLFRPHTGTRFRIGKTEYRLMNDDSIQAIVPKPKAITRA